MTNEEIKRIQKRARYVAKKRGHPHLADDFAQEIITHFLEGRGKHQTVDQFFIDYLRSRYGHSMTGDNQSRLQEQRSYVLLDEVKDLADHSRAIDIALERAELLRGPEMKSLDQQHRIVLILTFRWGLTLKEIGEMLLVSEGRVAQIVAEAVSELKRSLVQIESR